MNIFNQILLPTRRHFKGVSKLYRVKSPFFLHSSATTSVEVHSPEQEVVIALGSNVGVRLHNFNDALRLMKRYGPRPIDLDILFYGKLKINFDTLTVPHERIWERPFVMAPLLDLLGLDIESDAVASWHSFSKQTGGLFELWEKLGGDSLIGKDGLRWVFPFQSVESAVSQVRLMVSEGADIIDIGAQSTRPNASWISSEEELGRLIPVLEAVLEIPEIEGKLLSVYTFHSEVAQEAVKRGVHLINNVSGGQLDSKMLKVAADLGVPYVAMHMRGDPCTMQSNENIQYEDVCVQVASELYLPVRYAESSGVPAWRIIIDPGLGFSKNTEHNLDILIDLPTIRQEIAKKSLAVSHASIMTGPPRKRFLGDVCNRPDATERDPATIAAITAGILGGANIIRVHNVRDNFDATRLCHALLKHRILFHDWSF
ncbi:hypothetical protein NE237_006091 [Protea cynaroides]|uniref:Pterin-binding domain-containing protein n=1 Tax=Protea cynaroides TaxID=273540 RepID=A0A9Q0KLV0_9MAGN|nr:hypothetical protein NE237_006091 [Protea cynaroides]